MDRGPAQSHDKDVIGASLFCLLQLLHEIFNLNFCLAMVITLFKYFGRSWFPSHAFSNYEPAIDTNSEYCAAFV